LPTPKRAAASDEAASTRDKLLDVAEQLFIQHGFDAVSLRQITDAAKANIAAVNYHFGSKDGLIEAVIERQFRPLLNARAERLQLLEPQLVAGDRTQLPVLLESYLDPLLDQVFASPARGHAIYAIEHQLRVDDGPGWLRKVSPYLEYMRRLTAALTKVLQPMRSDLVAWKLQVMVGSLTHILTMPEFVAEASEGQCRIDDKAGLRDMLLTMFVDLFDAPLRRPSTAKRAGVGGAKPKAAPARAARPGGTTSPRRRSGR
jgi:AcrR family transcriptional regulator